MKDIDKPSALPAQTTDISIDHVRNTLPRGLQANVTQEMIDVINETEGDELRERFKENIISFTSVLSEGKYKFWDYIYAVKFVSFKLLGSTNTDAYRRTFPNRFQRLVDEGTPPKNIATYASAYNRNKLVQLIFERTLMPVHVLNMDIHQEAINVQAELMRSANSETVRQKAAECLITALKPPEETQISVKVGPSDRGIEALRETTRALALQQQEMIKSGRMSAGQIATSTIIEAEKVVEAEYQEMAQDA